MLAKKILLVDDDARNIFALSAVLKAKGFQVIAVNSAAEAFPFIKNDSAIGVILMDMMMPGVDGYHAMRQIKGTMPDPPPVIAITAQAMSGDREKCLAAGAEDYLSKPVDVDKLLSMLNEFIK